MNPLIAFIAFLMVLAQKTDEKKPDQVKSRVYDCCLPAPSMMILSF